MNKHKKKLIKKVLLFLTILFATLIILNFFYVEVIEKNKQIFRKELAWQEYRSKINSLDYAFFGDSHTENGLNPRFINNSYNFGISGQNYIETYYLIEKLLTKDNIEIKNLILEIDTHTFSDQLRNQENLFQELNYYSNFIPLKRIAELKNKSLLSIQVQEKFKIIGKGSEIISYFLFPTTEIHNGWTKKTKDFSKLSTLEKTKFAEGRCHHHFSENKNLLESNSLDHFIKTLNLAKNNNINVILIKYPVSYEYNLELEKNKISRENYYNSLFTRIDKTKINYKTLDYYDIFFENPEYFRDPNHLNYKGAEVLSKRVNEDLQNFSEHPDLETSSTPTN